MYKPKPEQRNTNRLRLDIETRTPSLFALENQLQEAKGRRGCLVELPWTTNKTAQMYILGVQWDDKNDLPVWTLYEQNGSESKMHWSNPYPPTELNILYDIVCMSAAEEKVAKIPEQLAPPVPEPAPAPAPTPAPAPVQAPPATPYPMPPPGMPYPPMPGYPMDPAMYPPGYAFNPYYPPPMPGQPMPYPPPGQGMPPPGWPQYPPPGGSQPPPPAPASPPPAPIPAPAPPKASGPGSGSVLVDYNLAKKNSKIQLGKLLMDSRLIALPMLEAALKLQDMVEQGVIEPEDAPHALHEYHEKGESIGEFLMAMPHDELKQAMQIAAEKNVPPRPKSTKPPAPGVSRAALDLLIKAGIITESDIKAAADVRAKLGGDLILLLQSAGKLDKQTYEAAILCLPLIREGLMKLEQCIIALNYCVRSRVDFDTALEEMNWPNPRKLRKDLPL